MIILYFLVFSIIRYSTEIKIYHLNKYYPKFYPGWNIAIVSFISIGTILGTTQFVFGLFIIPFEKEFGWTRTEVNIALTFGGITSSLASPFVGNTLDKYGPKKTMIISTFLVAIGFLLRSQTQNILSLYFFTILMFLGVPGSTIMPASKLIITWFPKTTGRMMGGVTSGNNLGSAFAVPAVATLLTIFGWRATHLIIGVVILFLLLIILAIVKDDNKKLISRKYPSLEDNKSISSKSNFVENIYNSPIFWLIIFGMTFQQFLRFGVVSQLIPHFDQIGLSLSMASALMVLLSIGGASSKLIFGPLSEIITARIAFIAIMFLQTIGLFILIFSESIIFIWLSISVMGLGMGGVGALTPLVLSEIFGTKNLGQIIGVSRVGLIVPAIAGPILAGLIYDNYNSYNYMFWIMIILLFIAIICFTIASLFHNKKLS